MLSRTEDDALLDIALQFGGTLDLSSLLERVLGLFAAANNVKRGGSTGRVRRQHLATLVEQVRAQVVCGWAQLGIRRAQ